MVALMGCISSTLFAQRSRPFLKTLDLHANDRIERLIVFGEAHRYGVVVKSGQFLHVTVDQRNADVSVALLSSRGDILGRRDEQSDTPNGPESLSYIARAADKLLLVVRTTGPGPRGGAYVIHVEALRPSIAQDDLMVRAEQRFHEARAFHGQTTDSLREATQRYGDALAMWRQLGEQAWQARTLLLLGDALASLDQPDSSLVALTESLRWWNLVGDSLGVADVLTSMGQVAFSRGEYPTAVRDLEHALRLSENVSDSVRQAWTSKLLGQTYLATSDVTRAVEYLERSLALFRAVGSQRGQAATLDRLAVAYRSTRQYERALYAHRDAARLSRQAHDMDLEMTSWNNMAVLLVDLGRFREALDNYARALGVARRLGSPRAQAALLSNIAAVEARDHRPRKALAHYQQALRLRRDAQDPVGEANTLNNVANLYAGPIRDYPRALASLRRSLVLLREVGDKAHQAIVLATLGKVYAKMTQWDRSLGAFAESVALSDTVDDRRAKAITLRMMAIASRDRGELRDARKLLAESLAIWEALRRTLEASGLRSSVTALFEPDYALEIDVLMRLHRVHPDSGFAVAALETAERARSRGLVDALGEARDSLRRTIDPALANEERVIRVGIETASRQETVARAESKLVRAGEIGRRVDSLLAAYDELQVRVRRANPRYASVVDPPMVSAASIKHDLLDRETLLLEYALGEDRSYLWAVTSDTIASYELPARPAIDSLVRAYYAQVTARNTHPPGETVAAWRSRIASSDRKAAISAWRLAQVLLSPARDLLTRRRLAIAAAGSLQYVPFAALPDPSDPGSRARAPLVLAHEIVSLPSASTAMLLRHRARARSRPTKVLAMLADPVFDATDPRVRATRSAAAAPANPDSMRRKRDATSDFAIPSKVAAMSKTSGALYDAGWLPRLTYARAEADAILDLVPRDQRAQAFDFDASLAFLLGLHRGGYRILHFASHALLNDERPELSAVALSLVDSMGLPVDGYLRLHHLYTRDLPFELVVLSACETAIGADIRGEGLASLARGFMYAGAQQVVGSTWKVDDKASSDLMRAFYSGMLGERQLSPARALQHAQVSLWRRSRGQSPFFWAGFTLQGDWH